MKYRWVIRSFVQCAVVSSLLACGNVPNAAEFFGLGHVPGEETVHVSGMSADGSVVVGWSTRRDDTECWRWTAETGMVPLAVGLQDSIDKTFPLAVSADGSTIVGYRDTSDGNDAFRWTAGEGFVDLQPPANGTLSVASDVSANGSVVVGGYRVGGSLWIPSVWTADGSVTSLGIPEGSTNSGVAKNVSYDGSTIAVNGASPSPSGYKRREAWLWTEDTDYVYLGEMYLTDMNSDGSVVVGFTTTPLRFHRWTADTGMEVVRASAMNSVSEDGSLAFGASRNRTARVWDSVNGDRDLRSVLVSEFEMADELQNWNLNYLRSTSVDNRIVVGVGTNPHGEEEAWMAILDPPLQAGDADQDWDFDQLDLVRVQVAGKYMTGQTATWGEGDWNGAPVALSAKPPEGDGVFNQFDIVAAQQAGLYLTGSYAAERPGVALHQSQVSVGYDAKTGEIWVEPSPGSDLTAINIDSASGIFAADGARNLGGSFDNDGDDNIFKTTFGNRFGVVSFGNVAKVGLEQELVDNDLTIVGSLAGGGDIGDVGLIYVPEPSSLLLLIVAGLTAVVPVVLAGKRGGSPGMWFSLKRNH